ncbi:SAM-dependent methyltransferase [Phytohabitans sp. ZYX-F-186]|uniref:SAM-dependent methyltransferase n=1 Tax=Phytohabitans maris TaxID=3071409 RepID=A0ABU0ZT35_9ACTN|nr:SAM-dependent methyltransferase [Phytohabitans sp. ZYX-F-186]
MVSHASRTEATARTDSVQRVYAGTPTPLQVRTRRQIRSLFDGLDLVHPTPAGGGPADLVPVTDWRTDPADAGLAPEVAGSPFVAGFLAAAGRVPTRPAVAGGRAAHAGEETVHVDPSGTSSPASAHTWKGIRA